MLVTKISRSIKCVTSLLRQQQFSKTCFCSNYLMFCYKKDLTNNTLKYLRIYLKKKQLTCKIHETADIVIQMVYLCYQTVDRTDIKPRINSFRYSICPTILTPQTNHSSIIRVYSVVDLGLETNYIFSYLYLI